MIYRKWSLLTMPLVVLGGVAGTVAIAYLVFFQNMKMDDSNKEKEEEESIGENDEEFYEQIEAPKFVDFTLRDSFRSDDRYWFCSRVAMEVNVIRPFVTGSLQTFYKLDDPIPESDRKENRRPQAANRGPRRDLRR